MAISYSKMSSGGKGNWGMFKERSFTQRRICAAGLPTAQPEESVVKNLQYYNKSDEIDAVMSDAIFPPPKPRHLPTPRNPTPRDMRHAEGMYTEGAELITPPKKTKFQTLASDFKETVYTSYWKKKVGSVPDPAATLPAGLDPTNTTFGKKTPFYGRLYDVVMPKLLFGDNISTSRSESIKSRKYCSPPYNPDLVFGIKSQANKDGSGVRCCLTDDRMYKTDEQYCIISSNRADNKVDPAQAKAGPMPPDFAYGIVGESERPGQTEECLVYCPINPDKYSVRKYLGHLNTVRAVLSKRSYLPSFFQNLYLNLKYHDKNHSGWLPKQLVYDFFRSKYIRFDAALIEPLLSMWNVFDGERIDYEKFIEVLNYRLPTPTIPKIPDIEENCFDYTTTYSDMTNPTKQEVAESTKADKAGYCAPPEPDIRSCLNPSMLSGFVNVTDMYAKRDPQVVKRVFEAAGEKFTDEKFHEIWSKAETCHSRGWVCFETFSKALRSAN